MKAGLLLVALAALMISAPSAYAVIGWTGNVWPCNNATFAETQDITVYLEVYKAGVTDSYGQGAGIAVKLFYKQESAALYDSVVMVYNVDKGGDPPANDEYMGTIPNAALEGGVKEMAYTVVTDETDGTTCPPTSLYGCGGDQCGNTPPFYYTITAATRQDVTVRFRLCLTAGVETAGDVCVTGGHAALTDWGSGVVMSRPCLDSSPKYYEVDVLFPAGSSPGIEYKYKKDDCATWEGTGNHSFVIDDTAPIQVLWEDGWEYNTPDCPPCTTPVDSSTWGRIKALYR
ncbi:MAG: hypothetical protein JW952_05035 [Candidatus Eisenbacteria bacterium]|nr:hypothetical protein [Candidatus Eisenbacteria bacterium]